MIKYLEKPKIVSLDPKMVTWTYMTGEKLTLVLHPMFDDKLIEFIESNKLQIGDYIEA